ncbi:MAG: transcription termination factor NusA, partial [Lachnospiraceae bacterium]|nr:transcription termination factor NusA [Lachnospiraceae bacterium]
KQIDKDVIFETIETSLISACKNHFGKSDAANMKAVVNRETGDFMCFAERQVVATPEEVEDPTAQISLEEAQKINPGVQVDETVNVEIKSKDFGRIATQHAKNVILQKIREEERSVVYNQYAGLEKEVVTGIVQRTVDRGVSINLGRADALLLESEMIKGEVLKPTQRVKVFILEVSNRKGLRITVSRTHPDLVKRLFEAEVTEISDGTVEIMSIAREAGSRTKMAVRSHDSNVDAVGACVGINGSRVNAIVDELKGEKIDIVPWDENPGNFIQNALAPSKVVAVFADPDEKTAKVVVPDYQLSLAIGKEGQNARLAAHLTGYKIDIKSETQAKDAYGFRYEDYLDDDSEYEEYDGEYEDEYAEEDYEDAPESGEYAEEDFEGASESGGYAEEGDEDASENGEYAEEDYEDASESGEYAEEDYEDASESEEYADGEYGDAGEWAEEAADDGGDASEDDVLEESK